jgi:hypothetical protein
VLANVLMRQFPNGAQKRQRHFARTVILQLLFVPGAAHMLASGPFHSPLKMVILVKVVSKNAIFSGC